MPTDLRPSRRVLEFAEAFGLLTPALAARGLLGGDISLARLVLAQLSTAGRLHRHLCRFSASVKRFSYYSCNRRPMTLTGVRAAYAAASFVSRVDPAVRIVPREFSELMTPLAQGAGADLPAYRPCYLRGLDSATPRVSLVWAARSRDMNTVVGHLDAFVSHTAFTPWRGLALAGHLEITCLFRSFRGSAELQRWLERRPVLSRAGGGPVRIPVVVHPAAALRG